MKRIAITGSTGFIGRFVAPILKEKGYAVYPLRIALSNPEAILATLKTIRPDTLLHLAWETTPGVYWHAPSNLDWLKSSLDLIEAFALNGGKRAVIAGSCAEITPSTLYGASKESLRLCCENFLSRQNVSFAWGRIFTPYGPHEKGERLVPSLIQKLLDEQTFHCSAQEHVRDFLFVEDVAAAFAALVDSTVLGTVDIGSGEGIRIGDLALHIARHLDAEGRLTCGSAPESPDNPSTLIANTKKLTHEVGFQPKYSLQEGIQKTITWWKNEIYH